MSLLPGGGGACCAPAYFFLELLTIPGSACHEFESPRIARLQRTVVLCDPLAVKNILRELRAERGWTQADLAARLNVSRQTVNAIETQRYEPSLSLAFSIAALFARPIEAIFQPARR